MKFFGLAVTASCFVIFSGCASAPTATHTATPSTGELRIIDAHLHTSFKGEDDTLASLMSQFKAANVVGAVSHTKAGIDGYVDLKAHNIIHCFGIRDKIDTPGLDAGLKSGKFSCVKIYLGYVYRYAFDPAYEPVYKIAAKYDVPVVFHTGDTYSRDGLLKYADPLTLDEVAVKHRSIRIVIAHCGNPWIQSAAEVAYKNPNVYLDGSALLIGNMRDMPRNKVDEYVVKPISWIFGYIEDPTKLMFGSDWSLADIGAYAEAFKRAIPKEHWQAVFHDNAVRVFKALKP